MSSQQGRETAQAPQQPDEAIHVVLANPEAGEEPTISFPLEALATALERLKDTVEQTNTSLDQALEPK